MHLLSSFDPAQESVFAMAYGGSEPSACSTARSRAWAYVTDGEKRLAAAVKPPKIQLHDNKPVRQASADVVGWGDI